MTLTKSEKSAFAAAFISGILAHLFIYTNIIPNFDGISRVYEEQQMTVSGRWFLHYTSYLHSFTQMPMVIGILAMFFLACTAVVVVHLLEIKSPLWAGIWGVLSVVSPAVAYTNTFTFTAADYCLSALMAAVAVWVVGYRKWGLPVAIVLIAFSMGIYQVYVTVAIVLSVLLVLKEAMNAKSKIKDIVRRGLKYVCMLGFGALLYYIILKIFLKVKNLKLLSYLGMNQLEQGYPVERLGQTIVEAYGEVKSFFFDEKAKGTTMALSVRGFVMVLLVVTIVLLIKQIYKEKLWKNPVKLIGSIILVLLIPMAVNFGKIMSPLSASSMTMKATYVYWCLLPIMLWGQQGEDVTVKKMYHKAVSVVIAGMILMMSFVYWQWDNVLYTMLHQSHRATLSFVTNVVGRIESCEGYQMGMPVVIIGGFPSDRYDSDIPIYADVMDGGALSSSVIPLNKHIYYYMNDWLNVPIPEPSEEEFLQVANSQEFQQMPLYPNDGSVKIIDGRVVVRMQLQFTPKAQYEKDYENRR